MHKIETKAKLIIEVDFASVEDLRETLINMPALDFPKAKYILKKAYHNSGGSQVLGNQIVPSEATTTLK